MSKLKILVSVYNFKENCQDGYNMLKEEGFEIIENPTPNPYTREQLLEVIEDIDAAIVGVDEWTEEIFSKAKKLKVLARYGIGMDNVDIPAGTKYGVKICNAPGSINGAAELCMAFMLMLKRKLVKGHELLTQGRWDKLYGTEIKGSKIGLVGYGRIAKLVSKKLTGFEAEVSAFDGFPDHETAKQYNVTIKSLDEILTESDIISCHLPSTPETRKIFNREAFAKMKDGAFFVNTSRGANVDEDALYDALKSGKLSGAALDVFEIEPVTKDNKLFKLENFIGAPHWGSDTYETTYLVGMIACKAVVDVVCKDIEPENYLNKGENNA